MRFSPRRLSVSCLECPVLSFRLCAVFGAMVCAFSTASAAVFGPGAEPPGVIGDVFVWSRGDAHSTYSAWDRFEGVADPTSTPFVDSTPDILQIGDASSIGVGPGYIPTSSGNVYSPFAAIAYTASAASGTAGGNHTRIVAQMRMSGGRVDPPAGSLDPRGDRVDIESVLLSVGGQQQAPDLLMQTTGLPPATSFSTEFGTDYLAVWDIAGSAATYDFAFNSAVSS